MEIKNRNENKRRKNKKLMPQFYLQLKIKNKLLMKFPEFKDKIDEFVDFLFRELIDEAIENRSSSIKRFGRFIFYKTLRNGSFRPRFKFIPSRLFLNSIKDDDYLLQKLEEKIPRKTISFLEKNRIVRSVNLKIKKDLIRPKKNRKEINEEKIKKEVLDAIL